jgi:hypothetical protein
VSCAFDSGSDGDEEIGAGSVVVQQGACCEERVVLGAQSGVFCAMLCGCDRGETIDGGREDTEAGRPDAQSLSCSRRSRDVGLRDRRASHSRPRFLVDVRAGSGRRLMVGTGLALEYGESGSLM